MRGVIQTVIQCINGSAASPLGVADVEFMSGRQSTMAMIPSTPLIRALLRKDRNSFACL